jgi:hypothetical protein
MNLFQGDDIVLARSAQFCLTSIPYQNAPPGNIKCLLPVLMAVSLDSVILHFVSKESPGLAQASGRRWTLERGSECHSAKPAGF